MNSPRFGLSLGISSEILGKSTLKSISANDDGIFIGTSHSEIICLRKPLMDANGKALRTQIRLKRRIRSGDHPVEQLAFLYGSNISFIVALCGKTVTIHTSKDLELLMTVPLSNASCFCISDGSTYPGLAVVDNTTAYLYNLQIGFDIYKPLVLPEQPVNMAWLRDSICLAFVDEYSLVSDAKGTVLELSNTGGSQPICRVLTTEEILVATKAGCKTFDLATGKSAEWKFSAPTKSLAFSFPYIFSSGSIPHHSKDIIVEVISILDSTYHEVIRAPPGGHYKNSFILSDDNINVYAMDQHNIWMLTPNYGSTPAQMTGNKMIARASEASPATTTSAQVSSLFTFKTTVSSKTLSSKSLSQQLYESMSKPLNASLPHYIEPPPPNDKASFVKYIRSILRQEHNPFRLLLVRYAAQIAEEFPASNAHNTRLEDVKKRVAIFHNRILRTLAPECKQFQSKTFRELLLVAVSSCLHSMLYPTLMALILQKYDEQNKSYNSKIQHIYAKSITPAMFEVRQKFWLTNDLISNVPALANEESPHPRSAVDQQQDTISRNEDSNVSERKRPAANEKERDLSKSDSNLTTTSSSPNSSNPGSSKIHKVFSSIPNIKSEGDLYESSSVQSGGTNDKEVLSPRSDSSHDFGMPSVKTSSIAHDSLSSKPKAIPVPISPAPEMMSPTSLSPEMNNLKNVFFLGDALLFQLQSGPSPSLGRTTQSSDSESDSSIVSSEKAAGNDGYGLKNFHLVDSVQVHFDHDHHLYFTFAKTGIERELSSSEWSFTFKDEERAIIWIDQAGVVWRLAISEKQAYQEFTTRYRLYEQHHHPSASVLASSNMQFGSGYLSSSLSSTSVVSLFTDRSTPSPLSISRPGSTSPLIEFGNERPSSRNRTESEAADGRLSTTALSSDDMTSPITETTTSGTTTTATAGSNASILSTSASSSSIMSPPSSSSFIKPKSSGLDLRRIAMEQRSKSSIEGTEGSNSTRDRSGSTSSYSGPYSAAVKTLRLISKMRSPTEKIDVMARALSYVTAAVDEFWTPHGKKVIVGADDLVPIFSYVTALARIPNIYSEMNYTMEFSTESSLRGKYGYSLATLQICVEHVCQVGIQFEERLAGLEDADLANASDPDHENADHDSNTSSGLYGSRGRLIGMMVDDSDGPAVETLSRETISRKTERNATADIMDTIKRIEEGKKREERLGITSTSLDVGPSGRGRGHSLMPRTESSLSPSAQSPDSSRSTSPAPPSTIDSNSNQADNKEELDKVPSSSSAADPSTVESKLPQQEDSFEAQGKYACTAMDVSETSQYEGRVWVEADCLIFESDPQESSPPKKFIYDIKTFTVMKKSWGLFGGDGWDIYTSTEKILFLRHLKNATKLFHDVNKVVVAKKVPMRQ